MSKFCAYCGTSLREDATFCQMCGAKQPAMGDSGPVEMQQNTASGNVSTQTIAPKAELQHSVPVAKKKSAGMWLICGGVALIAVVAAVFLLFGSRLIREAPFYGIEKGDSVEDVERIMGDPDDFDDNYMRNFNYYYEDIEFLDMTGYLDVHFKMDKVNTLRFVCSRASTSDYEDAVDYYTKKYGKPDYEYEDTSGSSGDSTYWNMEDGTCLMIEYYSASTYSPSKVYVKIFN